MATMELDKYGAHVSGSPKSYILSKVYDPCYVKVRVHPINNGDEMLLEGYSPTIHDSGTVLCVQSVHNFEATSGADVVRVVYFMCTCGKVHTQKWMVGTHSKTYDNIVYRPLTWFFTYLPVTEYNIGPNPTELIESIRNGAEIFASKTLTSRMWSVTLLNTYVLGHSTWSVSIDDAIAELQTDLYWYIQLFNSYANNFNVMRYYLDSSNFRAHFPTTYSSNINWYVNKQWSLAFEVDATGRPIYGCKSAFLSLVRLGHRVRIGVDNVYAEVSAMWVYKGELWAQIVDSFLLDGDNFDEPPAVREVRMVSTLGKMFLYHIKIHGEPHSLHSSTSISIKWFVDQAEWQTLYKDGQYISATRAEIFSEGMFLRTFIQDGGSDIFLNVDTIAGNADPNSGVIRVSSMKHLDVTFDANGLNDVTVTLPPLWTLYTVDDTGQTEIIRQRYDVATSHGYSVVNQGSTWFACFPGNAGIG